MKIKEKSQLTDEEKEWLETAAINHVIAQADGYQLGYARAISDFTEYIIDYWNGSDEKPQQAVCDALVDLGVELGKRKHTAEKNIQTAVKKGYVKHYMWEVKDSDCPFTTRVPIYTKDFEEAKNE